MVLRHEIIDNENGTWTIIAPRDDDISFSEIDPDLFTIFNANATFLDANTYGISDVTEAIRLQLHTLLINLLDSNNVYFQPPPSLQILYPCIIYKLDDINTRFANNKPYKHKKRYQVMVIDANPDTIIPEKVANLPLCSFDRSYTAANLNHYVFNLFF